MLRCHAEAGPAVPYVGGLDHELRRQHLLDAERPALRIRLQEVVIVEREPLADVRQQSPCGAQWLSQSGRERVGDGCQIGQAAVERSLDRRRLGESGLDPGVAVDSDGVVVNTVATTKDRLGEQLVGEPDAWLEVVLLAFVRAPADPAVLTRTSARPGRGTGPPGSPGSGSWRNSTFAWASIGFDCP